MWKRLTTKANSQQQNFFGRIWNRLTLRRTVQNAKDDFLENPFSRPLNFFHLNTLGLGAIIGAGIFSVSGTAAGNFAGPSIIISFVIAGFVAYLAAFSYAEMSSIVPASGSSYTYIYTTMGEFCAWLVGWDLCLEYMCAAATVGVAWSTYVADLCESLFHAKIELRLFGAPIDWNHTSETFYVTGKWFNLPAVSIILFLAAILIYDIDVSATFNSIIVVGKILILLIFIFTSIKYIHSENYKPFIPTNLGGNKYGINGMLHATTLAFFAYIGFDVITTAAQETKKSAEKLVPLSILTSLSIASVLYLGVTSVMIGVVKYTDLQDKSNPISIVSKAMGLRWLEIMMTCGAILGLTSVILVNMYAQPRILYAMARDGLLPEFFAKTYVSRRARKKFEEARRRASASAEVQTQTASFWEEVSRKGRLFMGITTSGKVSSPPTIDDEHSAHTSTTVTTTEVTSTTAVPMAEKPPGTPFMATIVNSTFLTERIMFGFLCIESLGIICSICAGFLPIDFLTEITSIGTLFAFLLVHIGVIVMHWTHRPSEPDNERLITFPSRTLILPLAGVGSCVALMHFSSQWTKIRFGVWTVIGQIIYWCYGRSHSVLSKNRHNRAMKTKPEARNSLINTLVAMERHSETISTTIQQDNPVPHLRTISISEGVATFHAEQQKVTWTEKEVTTMTNA